MNCWTRRLRLVGSPFATPTLADARMPPMRVSEDFRALDIAVRDDRRGGYSSPVLLGYAQYYEVMARIAVAARELTLDAPILFEVARPLGVPLPEDLLGADVMIVDRAAHELAFWREHATRGVLMVRVRLLREALDYGDNTLELQLHSRCHDDDALARLIESCLAPPAWRVVESPLTGLPPAARVPLSLISTDRP
jgi:hypothetical protein